MKFIDYSGVKIGDIEVIKRIENATFPSGQTHTRWECRCNNCGRVYNLNSQQIKGKIKNNITNCGKCGLDPTTSKNKYQFYDDYIVGFTSKKEPFFIDKEDYALVKDYVWYKNDQGYIVYKNNKTGSIRMHRLIMKHYYDVEGFDIDHIRKNSRNDNRKGNLRIVTRSQNNMNKNTYTGVYFDNTRKKWIAHIVIDHWNNYLGLFDDFNEAVKCRQEAEIKYFRENSYEFSQLIALEEPKWNVE